MLLIKTAQLAKKWKLSLTRIRQLAKQGRITGTYRVGRDWLFDSKAELLPPPTKRTKR